MLFYTCLKEKPKLSKFNSCGNGVLEGDEQCDCGPKEFCDNPCCSADTCRFSANATCASGECCDLKVRFDNIVMVNDDFLYL